MIINNEHIQTVNKMYNSAVGDSFDANPISKVDVDIINILLEMLNDYGHRDVVAVMNNYKVVGDEEVLNNLQHLLREFKQQQKEFEQNVEENDPGKLPYWLHFNDNNMTRLLRMNVISFSLLDNEEDGRYGILLNETHPDSNQIPIHANLLLEYYVEEQRDNDMRMLESLIKY